MSEAKAFGMVRSLTVAVVTGLVMMTAAVGIARVGAEGGPDSQNNDPLAQYCGQLQHQAEALREGLVSTTGSSQFEAMSGLWQLGTSWNETCSPVFGVLTELPAGSESLTIVPLVSVP